MDPHLCKDSCKVPSPGCKACENPEYFQCIQSGQCIHPDLVCDLHPQCTNGEDEDFLMCKEEYNILHKHNCLTHYHHLLEIIIIIVSMHALFVEKLLRALR